ncbi:sulfur carrier protein ThiS [Caldicellulosiruptor changbaiensis]|jgi:sulfur carrier protein|uniref:Thiamine biosynthesis protein ThiS n=4 Tax=Caldicellulosiruptoraceae TaxID=3071002 RepID=A4XJY9_CALS8|nr:MULTISPECIES: sulfur carrier protein ThiS [Caldicellulosiruptor]ABP67224.1 thiamine biosynthesis protein ThiS [Caldicellulosiruptor saccharolyticus DSM 8903]ADQ07264.1 thiamine biosynthesis protein ThiS [Caldicellulosiruptor hydrothermalis 108]AZT90625.1 sulfur carrier protein ThiS [Caldicellulosiruptor changbaiensis]WPX09882.1 sulfur carrier protein ThiS [Caldicellulosiruptor danielii]
MKIKANGNEVQIEREMTIFEMLDALNVSMKEYVTVQLNGQIIPRSEYDKVTVKDGDEVEFLYFMGGGLL